MPTIKIESDGTKSGTKVYINGTEITDIESLYFDMYRGSEFKDSENDSVGFSFTREELTNDGMLKEFSFRLPRKDEATINQETVCGASFEKKEKEKKEWSYSQTTPGKKPTKKLDPDAKVRNRPSAIFPSTHPKVKDNKDHFPIDTEARGRNALARVNQYSSSPPWWSGSLQELKNAVVSAVHRKYPGIKVSKEAKASIHETLERVSATIKMKDGKYCVYSKDGSKGFGCYKSRQEAEERLAQIEYFKKK